MIRFILLMSLLVSSLCNGEDPSDVESLLGKDNLVAWCIVPFDAKKRGPEARATMLANLGIKRCAYDWRQEHVPEFEAEIVAYKKHGIEFTAFWSTHDSAFQLFQKHQLKPTIWQTLRSPKVEGQQPKVEAAVHTLLPLVERTRSMGSKLGLYNHGGWGGTPENLVAVCNHLKTKHNARHVGIIYNFHHGHDDIEGFASKFTKMLPYLHCVNLNGMRSAADLAKDAKAKIIPIGTGDHEAAMINIILQSGYDGPIGILDHLSNQDAKVSLQNNLAGLEKLKAEL
jgi:hypothetical protein